MVGMSNQRRRRGFERAGSGGTGILELSSRRARTLRLSVAWRRVAGEEMAANVPAKGVSRGVVEFECDDPVWRARVEPVLADLAARLAATAPGPEIRRYRLIDPHRAGERKGPSRPIPAASSPDGEPATGGAGPGVHSRTVETPVEETRRERLSRLMRLYLERSGD
jgi:hypothetical protein